MVDGISVIMPTYNQAAFIRRAIFSLLQQTYLHWELVIVNDGSVDDTDRFVSSFLEDKRIIYLKNAQNEGLGYSLNKGIAKATYNYIAYLPSDDYYFRDHLEVLRKEFDKNVSVSAMPCFSSKNLIILFFSDSTSVFLPFVWQ